MVVNFRIRGINQDIYKLVRTLTLNLKKKMKSDALDYKGKKIKLWFINLYFNVRFMSFAYFMIFVCF